MSARALASGVLAVAFAFGSVLAWRDQPERGATTPLTRASASLDGPTLFNAKGCGSCHRSALTEPFGDGMPDLTDVAMWGGTRRPALDAAAYITESVRQPTAFIAPDWRSIGGPTTGMPALVVSDAELEAIADYLLG